MNLVLAPYIEKDYYKENPLATMTKNKTGVSYTI
jgi:hypothetical protein